MQKNQKYWYEFIYNGGSLWVVPESFVTQKMRSFYFKNCHLSKVYAECFESNRFDMFSETQREQMMSEEYFFKTGDLTLIPSKCVTEKMANSFINNGGDISLVPLEVLSFDMCLKYVSMGGNINNVPSKFRTRKLYDLCFSKLRNISLIPDKYKTPSMEKTVSLARGKMGRLYSLLYDDLINLSDGEMKLDDFCDKFNFTDSEMRRLIELIGKVDIDLYEKINGLFLKKQEDYDAIMMEKAKGIESMVEKFNLDDFNVISSSQKIEFAYEFYAKAPFCSIDEMWNFLNVHFDESNLAVLFFRRTLKFGQQVQPLKWLEEYNLCESMGPSERPGVLKFLAETGDIRTVTRTEVDFLLDVLDSFEVPLKNCIVKEAIRQYAVGDLDKFLDDLKGNDDFENVSNSVFSKNIK